jgi:hypothetical protein
MPMNSNLIEERLIKKIKDECVCVCSDERLWVWVLGFCEQRRKGERMRRAFRLQKEIGFGEWSSEVLWSE